MTNDLGLYDGCYVELRNGKTRGPLKLSAGKHYPWIYNEGAADNESWTNSGLVYMDASAPEPYDIVRVLPSKARARRAAPQAEVQPTISEELKLTEGCHVELRNGHKRGPMTSQTKVLRNFPWTEVDRFNSECWRDNGQFLYGNESSPYDIVKVLPAQVPDESAPGFSDSENAKGGLSQVDRLELTGRDIADAHDAINLEWHDPRNMEDFNSLLVRELNKILAGRRDRRIQELLEANTRYVERAREAEADRVTQVGEAVQKLLASEQRIGRVKNYARQLRLLLEDIDGKAANTSEESE